MVSHPARASLEEIAEAINGRIRLHHREMLRYHFNHITYLEESIRELEKRIECCLIPYRKEVELLDTIPGVNLHATAIFIAEMRVGMSVFKSQKHLASWAGLSPGNHESAGKKSPKQLKEIRH
jgi:transposase